MSPFIVRNCSHCISSQRAITRPTCPRFPDFRAGASFRSGLQSRIASAIVRIRRKRMISLNPDRRKYL
jgi:hypothetical protein